MKRRLEIGRGLIHHPKVLFLDEPTLGLDPQTRENIWEYIYNMTQTQDITVLLTTHYMEEADQLCDEVAIINKGEIITADSPSNLKRELKADTITLKVNDPEKFVEKAKELKFTRDIFFMNGEVKMMVERGENLVPEVVEFASSNGIHIQSIEVEHPNLEDVFIKYTGSKIVEGGR